MQELTHWRDDMRTYFYHVVKYGVKDEICLEYSITGILPQSYWHPAEGGEAEIVSAWVEPSGEAYVWSDEDGEKWRVEIEENHDHSDCDDDGI